MASLRAGELTNCIVLFLSGRLIQSDTKARLPVTRRYNIASGGHLVDTSMGQHLNRAIRTCLTQEREE
jgi:hypothetical protein